MVDISDTAGIQPLSAAITLQGTTPDDGGGQDILIGQHCSAGLSVSGLPSGYQVTGYQWSVTGPTFQSWAVSADQSHTTEVDGPGDLTHANPGWYWNEIGDGVAKMETVSCTATATDTYGARITSHYDSDPAGERLDAELGGQRCWGRNARWDSGT